MVTICLQCGDVGYANAYVYCVKCLTFAVHRYCLPEIPKSFDEFVDWVCDHCEEEWSGSQKALLNTNDGRCSESVISGSDKKSISQSSPGNNDNRVKTEPMLQSVPENPGLKGDARQSDRSDTTRELDGMEDVEVAADESLQITNLGEKTQVSSSVSGKEKQRLATTTDQKISDGEHQRDGKEVADRLSKRTRSGKKYQVSSSIFEKEKQSVETTDTKKIFDGEHESDQKEEAEVVADRLSKRTRLRKKTQVSSLVYGKEKQRLPTTSDQKIFDGKQQSDGKEKAQVVASRSSRRTRFGKNTQVSSSVSGKEKQSLPTTSDQKIYDGKQQTDGKEEAQVVANRSSRRTRFGEKSKVSSLVSGKEKHRLPTTSDQKIFDGEHQSDGKEEAQVVADRFSRKTRFGKNSGISSPIPEKEKQKHTTSIHFPTTRNLKEEASQQTHEARRSTHDIVREREKEYGEEGSFLVPTQSNVNGEDLQQTHGARTPMHIPTRSTVKEELSRYPIMTPPIAEPSGYSSQVKPQVEAIWRGKFHIVNKKDETFEGFVAHLSNMACQRVIEEARLLPVLLQLEMVPISTVWPKSFQKAPPSEEHIALYIFPADKRHEKKINSLADYMSKENLAMKSITENAELLIFPSTELQPMTPWRFQNKYYIWGVFKQKRSVSFDT